MERGDAQLIRWPLLLFNPTQTSTGTIGGVLLTEKAKYPMSPIIFRERKSALEFQDTLSIKIIPSIVRFESYSQVLVAQTW